MSEEVYTNLLDDDARRLDIVAETKLKEKDVVIIIHIEPQSYKQTDFSERMYHYYSLLYNKYQKTIIPIAVLSHEESWEESQFTIEVPYLKIITFNYLTLHLRKKNWRDYIHSNNPVAAVLLSEMGYSEDERIQVKKEFLRMVVKMELNPAKHRIIYGFFEPYLKLTEEEEEQLMGEINKLLEGDKIFEIPISYEEKGKEIGKKEVVIKMLKKDIDLQLIAEVTHLPIGKLKS